MHRKGKAPAPREMKIGYDKIVSKDFIEAFERKLIDYHNFSNLERSLYPTTS
jgi:hypothetical protein